MNSLTGSICLFIWCLNLVGSATHLTQDNEVALVQFDEGTGIYIDHEVGSRETLYSISRKYGTSIQSIKRANRSARTGIVTGVLRIPIDRSQLHYRLPLFRKRSDLTPVYYRVKPKDNVFRISRVYFDMPTSVLVNRNRIRNEALSPDQILHIGWLKSASRELEVLVGSNRDAKSDGYKTEFLSTMGEQIPDPHNEVAYWRKDSPAKGFYVMHRNAKERSYLEITNPLSSTRLYAKVIGRIPPHLYPEEVDMVLSQELAQALGAVDSKFFVRVRYSN